MQSLVVLACVCAYAFALLGLEQVAAQRGERRGPQDRNRTFRAPHPCEKSSCYPATGNLVIGREAKLSASSTCGLRGKERYCIVSHLEDRKKCFWCETRPDNTNYPLANHGVHNIVYRNYPGMRTKSWWQSENGVEDVSIRLDLEAEFHFTHLIITFKTFRPAAMLVERSFDFGKTWRVYRYFAHDCAASFPHVPQKTPQSLTEVICETRYSAVAPSTDGEIIFRVLPPNIVVDNPYSSEVQNLLKMTNLRINFTKLHTLGDDLLDNRAEIQEKYYYAVSEMTVRGSCSCYGHASRCLPLPGVEAKMDMVHGRCECTHNTEGLNCELCKKFYNDLPWRPAIGKTTNACKRCTCNEHSNSCHFDPAVYDLTGKVSGGVCDKCQHNTMGRNCEQCQPLFYRDPELDITHPEVCKLCDCDPKGSLDEGICDAATDVANNQESGRCHCKTNVEGRRCDACKNGFWNFDDDNPDGCQPCTCNALGTVDDHGCDVNTGECFCKRYVTGKDCNQCTPEYYGLSDDEEGCKPCNCDLGGSLDNNCDIVTGQCTCRHNVQGRTCNQPLQDYFSPPLDYLLYEAELLSCDDLELDPNSIFSGTGSSCQVVVREPFNDGREDSWTGPGFMKVFENDHLVFPIDNIVTSMDYDIVIRYEPQAAGDWAEVSVLVERLDPLGLDSPCANTVDEDDLKYAYLPDGARSVTINSSVCLEADKHYKIRINFDRKSGQGGDGRAAILIDSIVLVPKLITLPFFNGTSPAAEARRREFEQARCGDPYYYNINKADIPDICKKYHMSVGFIVFGSQGCQCDQTGSTSHNCDDLGGHCPCKTNVVGRRCNQCAPGTFGFGPDGCKSCDCNSIGALDKFCDAGSGQCKCQPNTYGRKCDECQPGYWNFPNCKQCVCHGHADVCDSTSGACVSCRNFTEGQHCDRCREGFYGDPRLGKNIPCRPCPCPGTIGSNHSFATHCVLDDTSQNVFCDCQLGYSGSRCDVCADNYFGHPETPGGSCEPCECNNNVDKMKPGNCDPHTGKCLQCLYDSEGDNCEVCRPGYFGDALLQTCEKCECEILGTNQTQGFCDRTTGQCPCFANVTGLHCDSCIANHWKIAIGEGCSPCSCDPRGSESEQCNLFTGQCECKQGFGGLRCDQCQANYWGDPNEECKPCVCDEEGSSSSQCLRDTGACVCHPGIGGYKCDQCARGFLGESCSPCGECFDNWDRIISGLLDQTTYAINNASKIKTIGATGAYSTDFEEMEKSLEDIENLINNTKVGESELDSFNEKVRDLRDKLKLSDGNVLDVDKVLSDAATNVKLAQEDLKRLVKDSKILETQAEELENNARLLQVANLEGALNLTREAKQHAMDAADEAERTQLIIRDSDRQIKSTEQLLKRQYDTFNNTQNENSIELMKLQEALSELETHIPELNDKMCGEATDQCGQCGGAGCGTCGGLACGKGALTKAHQALRFTNQTEKRLKEQETAADALLRSISLAMKETAESRAVAQATYDEALEAKKLTDGITNASTVLIDDLKQFLNNSGATPAEIRALAKDVLAMTIELKPEQITGLAAEINETVSKLTDIKKIIDDTRDDLESAKRLNEDATRARDDAVAIRDKANNVTKALEEASKAQALAEEAINQTNKDIESAKIDLAPIGSETGRAHNEAIETLKEVEALKSRLDNVQKNILTVRNDAELIKKEANDTVVLAEEAQRQARGLRQEYQRANASLSDRVAQSANSREKSRVLLETATSLASDTKRQLSQFKDMEDLYNSHVKTLAGLQEKIDGLNEQMDYYLKEIKIKTDRYQSCTS